MALVSPPAAAAVEFTVTQTADTPVGVDCTADPGNCSLREALTSANAATNDDEIAVEPGFYTLANGVLEVAGPVSIAGAAAATTIVSGNFAGGVFELDDAGGPTAIEISELTITDGFANQGGGLILASPDVNATARGVVITANEAAPESADAGQGGGVYVGGGSLRLEDSVVSFNTASSAFLTSTSGGIGGGIHVEAGAVTVDRTTIAQNSAESGPDGGRGGGVSVEPTGSLTVERSRVTANFAERGGGPGGTGGGRGGGIDNAGTLTVDASTIDGNTAGGAVTGLPGNGGGIRIVGPGTAAIANSTISGNTAGALTGGPGGQGGGIAMLAGTGSSLALSSSTVAFNHAQAGPSAGIDVSRGGDVWAAGGAGGAVSFADTIVSNGTATTDPTCFLSGVTATTAGGNLEDGDDCGFGPADLVHSAPLLAPLQDNGGPTPTHALALGSPALGRAVACPPPATDQRGVARPQGAACDVGAYELIPPPGPPPPPPPPSPPPLDAQPPAIASLQMRPAKLKRGKTATIAYQLSEAASVTFRVQALLPGHKSGGKCAKGKPKGKGKGKGCTRSKALGGSLAGPGQAGANDLPFKGKIGGKKLGKGKYRLLAVAQDPAGNQSEEASVGFKITE